MMTPMAPTKTLTMMTPTAPTKPLTVRTTTISAMTGVRDLRIPQHPTGGDPARWELLRNCGRKQLAFVAEGAAAVAAAPLLA